MGTTKTEIFSEEENRIAELGKAFAHPARVGIIDGSVEPPKVCYCINQKVWEEAKDIFFSLFGSISDKGCC